MSINELLEQAHELNPSEKYLLIESLIQDLNHIDKDRKIMARREFKTT